MLCFTISHSSEAFKYFSIVFCYFLLLLYSSMLCIYYQLPTLEQKDSTFISGSHYFVFYYSHHSNILFIRLVFRVYNIMIMQTLCTHLIYTILQLLICSYSIFCFPWSYNCLVYLVTWFQCIYYHFNGVKSLCSIYILIRSSSSFSMGKI